MVVKIEICPVRRWSRRPGFFVGVFSRSNIGKQFKLFLVASLDSIFDFPRRRPPPRRQFGPRFSKQLLDGLASESFVIARKVHD
jgi:hypothetical protein